MKFGRLKKSGIIISTEEPECFMCSGDDEIDGKGWVDDPRDLAHIGDYVRMHNNSDIVMVRDGSFTPAIFCADAIYQEGHGKVKNIYILCHRDEKNVWHIQ